MIGDERSRTIQAAVFGVSILAFIMLAVWTP